MCIPKKKKQVDRAPSARTPEAEKEKEKEKEKDNKDKDKDEDEDGKDQTPSIKKDESRSDTAGKDKKKEVEEGKKSSIEKPKVPEQSFKVAKSSKQAKSRVEAWVRRALDMGVPDLMSEFRALSKWKPETMTTNAFAENKDKNRYLDVPCQDSRRVILKWPGLDDYIHANYVATPNADHRFICAQGPLENTQHSFWAMIIQEGVECALMLCNTIECGKAKCMQYWPNEKDETLTFGEGEGAITITNKDVRQLSAEDPTIRVCKLKIDYKEDGKPKTQMLTHYQWQNWPDRGVPPTKLTAVSLLSEVRGSTKPILVHCSAGIGRTGTIVAIAYVQEKMQNGHQCMNTDELLKELRTQRPYSIQNEFQYIYLHRVLLAYFLEKYKQRFASIMSQGYEEKYAKWCADYKVATGCE